MKFKELYRLIAERHPEQCPAQGSTVSFARMAWLDGIHRDLQEIAIKEDGLWRLNETTAARYDRLELYERVWARPLQKVAREYCVSDVALGQGMQETARPGSRQRLLGKEGRGEAGAGAAAAARTVTPVSLQAGAGT